MYFVPEINVRGNISVMNWKELNPESTENVQNTVVVWKKEKIKQTENLHCSVTG